MNKKVLLLSLVFVISTIAPIVMSDSDTITVTLTPNASADIEVDQSSWDPSATLGQTESTSVSWATLDNAGLVQVDVTVNATNSTDWTLASSAGHNQFALDYLLASAESMYDNQQSHSTQQNFGGANYYAQILEPSSTFTCTKVSVHIKRSGSTSGNLNVSLWDVDSNLPSDIIAYNSSVSAGSIGTSYAWYDFNFDNPVTLTSGTKYALSLGGGDNWAFWWYVDGGDKYGSLDSIKLSSNSGSTWSDHTSTDLDFAFKVYGVETTYNEIGTTPASFATDLGADEDQSFGLRVEMPNTSSTNTNQTSTITFIATVD